MKTINISRPHPSDIGTGSTLDNEKIIHYIEPLRETGLVRVNEAYMFNLRQYLHNQPCTLSPGFKYTFEFVYEEDAEAFKNMFNGEFLDG